MNTEESPIKSVARVRGTDGKFLPGNIANPKGRPPRDCCLTDAMYALLSSDPATVVKKWQSKRTLTGAQRSAIAWYGKTQKADMTALKEALERIEGKVAQPVTGADGERLTFNLVVQSDSDKAALLEAKKRLT